MAVVRNFAAMCSPISRTISRAFFQSLEWLSYIMSSGMMLCSLSCSISHRASSRPLACRIEIPVHQQGERCAAFLDDGDELEGRLCMDDLEAHPLLRFRRLSLVIEEEDVVLGRLHINPPGSGLLRLNARKRCTAT